LDASFTPDIALGYGGVIAVQTEVDGKVLVSGDYTTVDGMPRKNLARLNANGSLDTSFNPGTGPSTTINGQVPRVRGIAIQADGKVLVGGGFNKFNGVSVNYLTRLIADQGGTVEFGSASFTVDENGGSATIAVQRTGSTNGTVAVNYLTSNGTATAGLDYLAWAGVLMFGPGETNKIFAVPILPDALVEGDETVNLALANPLGGVILGNLQSATLTIINNSELVVNTAPVLGLPPDQTIIELATLIVTNAASDIDFPPNTLTYQLKSPPSGASIDNFGVIHWTPSETQGPSTNMITTVVTDNGVPPLSATNSFSVIVTEVNSTPVLSVPTTQTVTELSTLTVTNTASDADLPANTLTFSLVSAPSGVNLNPSTGVLTWTPTE